MSVTRSFKDLQLHWVWQQGTAQLRDELIAFWHDQGALNAGPEAWQRTFQVACVARNAQGQIVGVSSVYADRLANGTPYWFYRTFIRADRRDPGLAPRLFSLSFEQLQQACAGERHAPVGLIVITENPKLETPAGIRVIERAGLQRLGLDASGRSVWQRAFDRNTPHD